jgi:catechol 2,3-dioxygenase-like lactoylglutathione lyase family enzyme
MLGTSPIMAFAATSDAARAKAFYQDVLQLKLTADDGFALIFDANGTMLRVTRVKTVVVAPYTILGWKVADIGLAMRDLTSRGVRFEKYEGLGQDQAGVCTFPGGTKVAWFKDPDGSTLSLTQFPE